MGKASEAALAALHGAIAHELTRRIAEGEASAADLGAAIKFLKDNSITASIEDNAALGELRQKLDERLAKRGALPAAPQPLMGAMPTAADMDDVLDSLAHGTLQ